MSHAAGTTSSAALSPPRTALCFQIHGMFNWMPLCERRRRSGGGARRSGPLTRFIDATASRERICSAQKTLKREAGMEGAQERRGRGWPVYAIQQQIAVFKTERTRCKHAYKPTFVRRDLRIA